MADLARRLFEDLRREVPGRVESLSTDALELLTAYSWPGNVRELRNLLEWALILAGKFRISRRATPPS